MQNVECGVRNGWATVGLEARPSIPYSEFRICPNEE